MGGEQHITDTIVAGYGFPGGKTVRNFCFLSRVSGTVWCFPGAAESSRSIQLTKEHRGSLLLALTVMGS